MRQINISRAAAKSLKSLPKKHAQQIGLKIYGLLKDPLPQDTKKLKGYQYLRCDSGEYRIIYTYDDTMVCILLVGKRNDNEIYRNLAKLV